MKQLLTALCMCFMLRVYWGNSFSEDPGFHSGIVIGVTDNPAFTNGYFRPVLTVRTDNGEITNIAIRDLSGSEWVSCEDAVADQEDS